MGEQLCTARQHPDRAGRISQPQTRSQTAEPSAGAWMHRDREAQREEGICPGRRQRVYPACPSGAKRRRWERSRRVIRSHRQSHTQSRQGLASSSGKGEGTCPCIIGLCPLLLRNMNGEENMILLTWLRPSSRPSLARNVSYCERSGTISL
jgi:hypothetical protein